MEQTSLMIIFNLDHEIWFSSQITFYHIFDNLHLYPVASYSCLDL